MEFGVDWEKMRLESFEMSGKMNGFWKFCGNGLISVKRKWWFAYEIEKKWILVVFLIDLKN